MQEDRELRLELEAADRRPFGEIVAKIIDNLQTIFREEVRLARQELREKVRESKRAGFSWPERACSASLPRSVSSPLVWLRWPLCCRCGWRPW